MTEAKTKAPNKRVYILHPYSKRPAAREALRDVDASLDEAVSLAEALGLEVMGSRAVALSRMHPATLIGQGVVEETRDALKAQDVGLVYIDAALGPVQQRNLERAWNCKVIDRTGLVIEIFAQRARTAEGRLQVDLAQYEYQRSRLVRTWTHLERQRGGHGFLAGPGETQLEIDRRLLDEKISRLKKDIEQLKRTRGLHRQARSRIPYPVVALVGYTNAGKSTLFNQLTRAEVFAEDMLFATLDPTLRSIKLPSGRDVILSDTVGFISNLPTQLVAAFQATLEEVTSADIILHVRDVAHPYTDDQKADVLKILSDIGVITEGTTKIIEVCNKLDLLSDEQLEWYRHQAARDPRLVLISALKGDGVDQLMGTIETMMLESQTMLEIVVPYDDGAHLAWLYAHGSVKERNDLEDGIHLKVYLDPINLARYENRTHDG